MVMTLEYISPETGLVAVMTYSPGFKLMFNFATLSPLTFLLYKTPLMLNSTVVPSGK